MISPAEFQRKALGRKLWGKQIEIVNGMRTYRSISVKGCHGSGKTYAFAGMVPYELLGNPDALVLTIAPTLRQVKNMWSEIETAIQALPVRVPERTTTGWEISDHCKAIGFSSSKGVNAQGFHGKRVLILADEAIGISGELWDAIDGIKMAGDVRIAEFCNPTVPTGPVYENHTRLRGRPGHHTVTISAFDTPNLQGTTMEQLLQMSDDELEYAPYPWLTRRRSVVEMYHKWGPNSPRFQSRVLGEFPTQPSDSVFQLTWIEKAALPWEQDELKPHLRPGVFVQVGIDVAGPGEDETTGYARCGPLVLAFAAWSKADPILEVLQWLGKVSQIIPGAAIIIMGDADGIGFHFLRQIARLGGYDVRAFRAGGAPIDLVMFANIKAEAYWTTREYMRQGAIRGVEDEDTKAQLSDIRYRELPNGRIEIEHKDQARARGSSSPDRAEALIMAFHRIVPRVQTVYESEIVQISQY